MYSKIRVFHEEAMTPVGRLLVAGLAAGLMTSLAIEAQGPGAGRGGGGRGRGAVVNDIVWYNESGQRPDALVRFDPGTETFPSWAIPSGVGIIRHMRATPSGHLVIHQSSSNRVDLVTIGPAK